MQRRRLWRQLAHQSRVAAVAIVSVLLTLTMVAGLVVGVGSIVIDRKLARHGISDWSINIASISTERLVIQRLSLTIAPRSDTIASPPPEQPQTIKDLWGIKPPSWLPDTLIINEFVVNDQGLTPYQQYAGQLTLALNPIDLTLKLTQPRSLTLNLAKQPQQLVAQLRAKQVTAHARYHLAGGDLVISAQPTIPLAQIPTLAQVVAADTVSLTASFQGQLQPTTPISAPPQILNSVSGALTVALTQPIALQVNDINSTLAADVALTMTNGVINHYRLAAHGQLTQLPALKIDIDSIDWRLFSADQLSIEPLRLDQLLAKRHWPVQLSATVNGADMSALKLDMSGTLRQQQGEFEQLASEQIELTAERVNFTDMISDLPSFSINALQMPLTMTLTPTHLRLKSDRKISANIESKLANFAVNANTLEANIPFDNISETVASVSTKISNVRVSSPTFMPFNPIAEQTIDYNAGSIQLDGQIRLPSDAVITHQTRITADNRLHTNAQLSVAAIDGTSLKTQLANYLHQRIPLLSINDGSATANLELAANLNDGQWQISNGNYRINNVDAIYDTTAIADASLAGKFAVTPKRLQLTQNQLEVGSIQQGFSIGPIAATFDATVPFDDPKRSAIDLKSHHINAFTGTVTLPNQTYQLAQSMRIPVVFERLSLGEIMRQYPTNKVALDGSISGTLPLYWDTKQLTVDKGYVSAVAPGGLLQVDSSALRSAVGSRPRLQTAVSVLENFYYRELSSVIDYDANGELTLKLQLVGYNPAVENGRTVKLNINIEEDLPALIKGLQLSNSVSDVIRKRIQQRIN